MTSVTHENELETTLEQLARMRRALAELDAEKDRYSPAWLAVLAEGPLEEIRLLEQQLDVLTGRGDR